MPSGAQRSHSASPEPQCHPSAQYPAHSTSPGLRLGLGGSPSSSLPALPRSAQTASLAQIFPEGQVLCHLP